MRPLTRAHDSQTKMRAPHSRGAQIFLFKRVVGRGVPLPSDAERVEASELHVYPGLIDADSVLGLTEIGAVRATLDMREIGEVNPNIRAEIAVNPDSELLRVARANGITTARTAPTGGSLRRFGSAPGGFVLIAGTSALIQLDGWTWKEMTLAAPVSLEVHWPGMTIDRRAEARQTPEEQEEERDRLVRAIRDAFGEARAYGKARDAAA